MPQNSVPNTALFVDNFMLQPSRSELVAIGLAKMVITQHTAAVQHSHVE